MKHIDCPEVDLAQAILGVARMSSGTAEDIAMAMLLAAAMFIQNNKSCTFPNGINCAEGFAKAALGEYKELEDFRRSHDEIDEKRMLEEEAMKQDV